MAYEVLVTPQAVRDLGALPEKVRPAILEAIYGSIANEPERAGKRLQRELAGLFSARRGDYRIIYSVDHAGKQVIVLGAAHRRSVYRRL